MASRRRIEKKHQQKSLKSFVRSASNSVTNAASTFFTSTCQAVMDLRNTTSGDGDGGGSGGVSTRRGNNNPTNSSSSNSNKKSPPPPPQQQPGERELETILTDAEYEIHQDPYRGLQAHQQ